MELQQNIDALSNEFKYESQKLHLQNANISTYQRKLEGLIDETQALIDRRINEKFNAISHLLAAVTTKTEEITLLLNASEIQLSPKSERFVETKEENYSEGSENPRKQSER